jgi:outer membrane protein
MIMNNRVKNMMWLISLLSTANAYALTPAKEVPGPAQTKSATVPQTAKSSARQKLITSAAELIKKGFAADAYDLLTPYQSEMAGDPDFDYLLGIAALDTGKPNEAIFALERALAVRPNHLQARAEIARAYLAAGEVAAAKQEFETVQKQNPPKEVNETIAKYLGIIEADRSGKKTILQGYMELAVGYDSNVNTATSNRQVAIPYFSGATLTLNDAGVATSDTFATLGAGMNVRHELTPQWAVLGGANVFQRNNATQQTFNNGNGDANLGINLNDGNNNYLVMLQLQSFILNSVTYRNATGMTGQWQRTLASGSQINSYLQYSSLAYPTQTYRNADRYVLGSAYATTLSGDSAPVVYVGGYLGTEQPLQSGLSYLASSFYGIKMGGEMKLNTQFSLLASSSLESRMNEGADLLFQVKRNDTQFDLKVGVNYFPAKKWTIGSSLAYTNNNSNIIINKYDRTMLSFNLRRDFN